MYNERLIQLLTQKQSGDLTPEEQLELSDIIKKDAAAYLWAESFEDIFNSRLLYTPDTRPSTDRALHLVRSKIRAGKEYEVARKGAFYKRYWAAAAVAVLVGCGIWFQTFLQQSGDRFNNIVVTQKGSKTNLVLPDGTRVWVNSDSKLCYSEEFGIKLREVFLEGEAFFEVSEDKRKPFIVHAGSMNVKVLGTAFNVRAYAGDASNEATLIRGSIEVALKNETKRKLLLSPREKIVVRVAEKTINVSPGGIAAAKPAIEIVKLPPPMRDTVPLEAQWTRNRLAFEEETLADIIPVLERWYNITIEIQGIKNSSILYRGSFENDSLADVLESLKAIGQFHYKIQKNKVTIY